MGNRNDDISLKLAKAVDRGFFPDVNDNEVDFYDKKAKTLFGNDSGLSANFLNEGLIFVSLGDSLAAQAGTAYEVVPSATVTTAKAEPRGWQTWALAGLNQRLIWVNNAGVGGDTTTMMLARMEADVYAYNPNLVSVQAGRNDIFFTSDSAEVIMERIKLITSGIISNGAKVALFTICAATSDDATQKNTRRDLNNLIRRHALTTKSVILVDTSPYWVVPATGLNASYVTYDGTHPTTTGASRLAKAFVDAVSPVISGTPARKEVISDYINVNPFFTGTTGGKDTGITGDSPDSWVAWAENSVTAVLAKVARTDGLVQDYLEINITGVGGVRLSQTGITTGLGTTWNPGDSIYIEVEYELDSAVVGLVQLSAQSQLAGSGVQDAWAGKSAAHAAEIQAQHVIPTKGILRSPIQKLAAGTTSIGLAVWFQATSGKVRLGRAGIVKV